MALGACTLGAAMLWATTVKAEWAEGRRVGKERTREPGVWTLRLRRVAKGGDAHVQASTPRKLKGRYKTRAWAHEVERTNAVSNEVFCVTLQG